MVRLLLAVALLVGFEQVASAQMTLTMNNPTIAKGSVSADGTIVLPQGWTAGGNVTLYCLPTNGGATATYAIGKVDATGKLWNDGNNPPGPILIKNLPTGNYTIYATVGATGPNAATAVLSTPLKPVMIP